MRSGRTGQCLIHRASWNPSGKVDLPSLSHCESTFRVGELKRAHTGSYRVCPTTRRWHPLCFRLPPRRHTWCVPVSLPEKSKSRFLCSLPYRSCAPRFPPRHRWPPRRSASGNAFLGRQTNILFLIEKSLIITGTDTPVSLAVPSCSLSTQRAVESRPTDRIRRGFDTSVWWTQ